MRFCQTRGSLILLMLVFFLLDRLVKNWVVTAMAPGQSMAVIPDVFHITFVYNTGMAFSLFKEHPGVLLFLTSLLFLGFLIYSLQKSVLTRIECLGFSLILGGALGNIADRVLVGKVIDYLDVTLIHYPIFNLADAFIFCGVLFIVGSYFQPTPKRS